MPATADFCSARGAGRSGFWSGAKSAGELANPAVGAAIANAIDAAVGVRVMSLPITAEKVRSLLRTKELRAAEPG